MIKLKELRKSKKLSQTEFAEIFNLTQNTVSRYESGKHEPSLETAYKIADFFGVTIGYFYGIEDENKHIDMERYNVVKDLTDEQLKLVKAFIAGITSSK